MKLITKDLKLSVRSIITISLIITVLMYRTAYKTKFRKGRVVKLAILLIIVVVGVYIYTEYGGLPSSLVRVILSGKQINGTTLQTLMFQNINSQKQFTLKYNGSITINNDPPFGLIIMKVYNQTTYIISLNNFPKYGSTAIQYSTNSTNPSLNSICISGDQMLQKKLNNVYTPPGSSSDCFYTQYQQIETSKVINSFINITSLTGINITSYSISNYYNMPCYLISGTGNIDVNSTLVGNNKSQYTPANIKFSSCLSSQYNVPLSFNTTIKTENGAVVNITADEFLIIMNNTEV